MPNWCNNRLKVTGPKKEVAKFIKENEFVDENARRQLSFAMAIPQEKNNQQWGTKWDAHSTLIKVIKGGILYDFDTAWGPPDRWFFLGAVKKNPKLNFRLSFDEPMMDLRGILEGKKGVGTRDDYNN